MEEKTALLLIVTLASSSGCYFFHVANYSLKRLGTYLYGNCSSQPPRLIEELPQWSSGPSLVTPTAESPPDTKPGQTVFYARQILFNYWHRLTKNA
jgi:hypothetical protein